MHRLGHWHRNWIALVAMLTAQTLACGAPAGPQPAPGVAGVAPDAAPEQSRESGQDTAATSPTPSEPTAPSVTVPAKHDAIGAAIDEEGFLGDVAGYLVDEACPDRMLDNAKASSKKISVTGMNEQRHVEIEGADEATFHELSEWVADTLPPGRRALFGFVEFPAGTPYGWRAVCVSEEPDLMVGELTRVESMRAKGLIVSVAAEATDRLKAKGAVSGRLAFGKGGYQLLTPTELPLSPSQGIVLHKK